MQGMFGKQPTQIDIEQLESREFRHDLIRDKFQSGSKRSKEEAQSTDIEFDERKYDPWETYEDEQEEWDVVDDSVSEYTPEELAYGFEVLTASNQANNTLEQYYPQILQQLFKNEDNIYDLRGLNVNLGGANLNWLVDREHEFDFYYSINPSFKLTIDKNTNKSKGLIMNHGSTDIISSTSVTKESTTEWIPGHITLHGVETEVGKKVVAKITQEHFRGMKSGQDTKQSWMMGQLKASGAQAEKNYIKGHLMNDNLGGPAVPMNLYPITALANKKHNQWVEQWLKREVKSGYVMNYTVTVNEIQVTPGTLQYSLVKGKNRYPNARPNGATIKAELICETARYKADGTLDKPMTITIPSEYDVKTDKEKTDVSNLASRYNDYKAQSKPINHTKVVHDSTSAKHIKSGYSDDNEGVIADYDNNLTVNKV